MRNPQDLNGTRESIEGFVRREIFYISVVIFDVFALALLAISPMGQPGAEPQALPRHLEDLGRLFNGTYLEWARHVKPHMVMALALLAAAMLICAAVGTGLLLQAVVRVLFGRPALPQRPIEETRWNLWDVFKIAAIYPFLILLAYSALSLVAPLKTLSRDAALLAGLGVNYFAMAGGLLLIWRVVCVERAQTLQSLGYTLRGGPSDLARAGGCYAAFLPLFLMASQCTQMIASRFGVRPQVQEIVPIFISEDSVAVTVALILLACVLAPIVEETFFRGFLQPAIRKLVGQRLAIILTALLFALAHRSLSVFLPVFVLGLVLGYLYEKTQSTVASAILHGLHNTATTCFLLIIKYMPVQNAHS